jgi:hypothetical protein
MTDWPVFQLPPATTGVYLRIPWISVFRGLDPRIHAFAGALEGVDAHGTNPWAEGPRAKLGQTKLAGRLPRGDQKLS